MRYVRFALRSLLRIILGLVGCAVFALGSVACEEGSDIFLAHKTLISMNPILSDLFGFCLGFISLLCIAAFVAIGVWIFHKIRVEWAEARDPWFLYRRHAPAWGHR